MAANEGCLAHFVGKRGLSISPERKARNRTANTLYFKNKLRTIQPQIFEKIKNNQPELKFTGSYKTRAYLLLFSKSLSVSLQCIHF